VQIVVDGERLDAHAGESLAVALAAAGKLVIRHSPVAGGARGMFCLMGVCQECLVHVDGLPVTACTQPVREGIQVTLDIMRARSLTEGD
jgi:predicted molibdopterin-dependent oxidoreductase YjgC